jgi:hypothetical protein
MNTSFDPSPPALPPPLPANFIPRNYREKIRAYTSARRGFLARRALQRVVAIVLACAIAAIVADIFFETPDFARRLILGGLAVSALVLLTWWWWRPAIALDEPETIRELERRIPELGQQLRTAREAENATSDAGLVGVLASGLVANTRVRISGMDLNKLIPWRSIRPSLYLCLALILAFAALFATWRDFRIGSTRLLEPGAGASFTTVSLEERSPNFTDHETPVIAASVSGRHTSDATLFIREEGAEWKAQKMDRAAGPRRFMALLPGRKQSFDYYVTSGDGRSAQQRLHCLLTPRIEKAEAEIQFPDYIGEPPKHSAGGDVKAVEDSKATVIFQVNPPLTQATAHAADGRYLPLTISGNQVILEQKLARGEVVYELSGSDAEGMELPPSNFKLTGIEDKAPEVQLVEPKKDVEATSVWEILARVTAKDDFGLAEVGIILVVGNDVKMIAHREIAEKNMRAVSEMGTAALEDFPLTINDNLKVYAFARDHKPRDGARSVSKLISIDIRQFKTRWRAIQSGSGLPMSGQQLGELFNLIKEQRGVVSDTFVLKENGAPSGGDLGAECDKIRTREDAISERATKLRQEVEAAGTMNADDLTMLSTAAQQMGEASGHLEQRLPRPAYKQAERALSSLLALRKEIMRLMAQSKAAMPSEAEKQSKATSLSDLAAEAARLAKEEHETRDKVTSDPPPPERELEVTRHQQEVAVTDAGELFASLVRHPGASELALQRMEEAEKLMQKAEETMKGSAPRDAGPGLQSAEDTLLKLAAQLRALDEKNMDETMGKLAQMAAEAKARLEKSRRSARKARGRTRTASGPIKPMPQKDKQGNPGRRKRAAKEKAMRPRTAARQKPATRSGTQKKAGNAETISTKPPIRRRRSTTRSSLSRAAKAQAKMPDGSLNCARKQKPENFSTTSRDSKGRRMTPKEPDRRENSQNASVSSETDSRPSSAICCRATSSNSPNC